MSFDWLASLEEHISDQIELHGVDDREAWFRILDMAQTNLDAIDEAAIRRQQDLRHGFARGTRG